MSIYSVLVAQCSMSSSNIDRFCCAIADARVDLPSPTSHHVSVVSRVVDVALKAPRDYSIKSFLSHVVDGKKILILTTNVIFCRTSFGLISRLRKKQKDEKLKFLGFEKN